MAQTGEGPETPSRCIPLFLHGDEGRGQCKRPVLVVSFQCVIGWSGDENVNSKKRHATQNFVWKRVELAIDL